MIPAESYSIHQTNFSLNDLIVNDAKENKIRNIFDFGINLIVGFLSIKEIGFVSAQEIEIACCMDNCDDTTADDATCTNLAPTSCANTQECQKGCCYDSVEGLCTANAPRGKCELQGGTWSNDARCNRRDCRYGCCIYGNNFKFTTEKNCEKISLGFEKDWRQINEAECHASVTSQKEGACVIEKNCKFETESQCYSDRGKFYQNVYCSANELKSLGINCGAKASTGCIESRNLYNVYNFDSCGNRENIKEECSYPFNKCSEVNGNFICKDLNCDDAPDNVGTKDRKNGERWCLYDGYIGDGRDTVGSEHYLASCINGEVEIDRCGEYRSSLCQQQTITEGSLSYTTANCVVNEATKCNAITASYFDSEKTEEDLNTMIEDCNENVHCRINNINIGSYFKFSTCIPKYPKGDILNDGVNGNVCNLAKRDCIVVYEKGLFGWECKEDCNCESAEFAKEMNEFCISIGDCGSKVNYLGEGTDSVKITGRYGSTLNSEGKETGTSSSAAGSAPSPYSYTHYENDANPVSGQFVPPKDVSEELTGILGSEYDASSVEDWMQWTGYISGGIGIGAAVAMYLFPTIVSIFTQAPAAAAPVVMLPTIIGGALTYVAAIGIGISLGYFLGSLLNRSPDVILALMILGGIAGAGVATAIVFAGASVSEIPVAGWIVAAIAVIIAALLIILGIGERETRIVEFKCLPWVAPKGGNDCEKCDDDPLRECTEYKCSALGQLCEFKNAGTEHPICVKITPETNPPVITAREVKSENHEFANEAEKSISIVTTSRGCIQEFENIWFILDTDEFAQCQYSFVKPTVPDYDQMEGELPIEENLFTKEHNFYFPAPSIEYEYVENVHEVDGGAAEEGEIDMYVKCQDGQEPPNFNIDEYVVHFCIRSGPDGNVVDFNKIFTSPENGATLKYGDTEEVLTIWTDEKSECKYDTAADRSYEDMSHTFVPARIKDFMGWKSSTTLTGLTAGDNKFYIKCNDTSGNINAEDYEYNLKVSESELKIDSVSFKYGVQKIVSGEKFEVGVQPVTIEMEVVTSGGMENGKSLCYWGVSESGTINNGGRWLMSPYYSAGSTHTQLFPKMEGTHITYSYCIDNAGNEATSVGEFVVEVDNFPPKVIRALKDGQSLKIVTDELAKCYYDLNRCTFNLENGTSMSPTFSEVHKTTWKQGTYHIKCEDVDGNENPDCAIEVIPSI